MMATAMMITMICGPKIDSISSAKISDGIDMITSASRPMNWSNQPPLVAARSPASAPKKNAASVADRASPTELRVP